MNQVENLLKQYQALKAKYPETILFFRMGDFFETFGDDAIKTAKVTGLVTTKRMLDGKEVAQVGFPHHQIDTYHPMMIRAGHPVAVCETVPEGEKPTRYGLPKPAVFRNEPEPLLTAAKADDVISNLRMKPNKLGAGQYDIHFRLTNTEGAYAECILPWTVDKKVAGSMLTATNRELLEDLIRGVVTAQEYFKLISDRFEAFFGVGTMPYETLPDCAHKPKPEITAAEVKRTRKAEAKAKAIADDAPRREKILASKLPPTKQPPNDQFTIFD